MYRLATTAPADEWLTLIEAENPVRVRLRPVGPSAVSAASQVYTASTHPVADFAKDAGFDAYSRELCRRAIVEWEGVGQNDAPAPVTLENIDALLSDPTILARLQRLYVYPYLERDAEKNASTPSSSGTSPATTGAKGTAAGARTAAKRARTPSTSPKPTAARKSGR